MQRLCLLHRKPGPSEQQQIVCTQSGSRERQVSMDTPGMCRVQALGCCQRLLAQSLAPGSLFGKLLKDVHAAIFHADHARSLTLWLHRRKHLVARLHLAQHPFAGVGSLLPPVATVVAAPRDLLAVGSVRSQGRQPWAQPALAGSPLSLVPRLGHFASSRGRGHSLWAEGTPSGFKEGRPNQPAPRVQLPDGTGAAAFDRPRHGPFCHKSGH
jgi:hypothetical protein